MPVGLGAMRVRTVGAVIMFETWEVRARGWRVRNERGMNAE
jgi:hypothetical protein